MPSKAYGFFTKYSETMEPKSIIAESTELKMATKRAMERSDMVADFPSLWVCRLLDHTEAWGVYKDVYGRERQTWKKTPKLLFGYEFGETILVGWDADGDEIGDVFVVIYALTRPLELWCPILTEPVSHCLDGCVCWRFRVEEGLVKS